MASNLSQSLRHMNNEVPLKGNISLTKEKENMMFGVCAHLFLNTFFSSCSLTRPWFLAAHVEAQLKYSSSCSLLQLALGVSMWQSFG